MDYLWFVLNLMTARGTVRNRSLIFVREHNGEVEFAAEFSMN